MTVLDAIRNAIAEHDGISPSQVSNELVMLISVAVGKVILDRIGGIK